MRFQPSAIISLTRVCAACLIAPVALAAGAAAAQSPDALAECARLETDPERLACFDRVVGGAVAPPAEAPPPPADAPAPPADASTSAPPAEAPAPPAEAPAPPESRASEPPAAAAVTEPEAELDEATIEAFGMDRPVETPEEIDVRVVAVRATASGAVALELDNGQVWVQIRGRTRDFPAPPFEAVIEEGSLGSYFIRPEGGRMIRVRRQR